MKQTTASSQDSKLDPMDNASVEIMELYVDYVRRSADEGG